MAMQVAALTGSGVSYLVSGKTLTDHAVSSVLDKDCRVFRAIDGKTFCEDHQGQLIAAQRTSVKSNSLNIEGKTAIQVALARSDFLTASDPGDTRLADIDSGVTQIDDVHLVIGSFARRDNAERMAEMHEQFHPRIFRFSGGEIIRYRVVVSSSAKMLPNRFRDELKTAGIVQSWQVRLCAAERQRKTAVGLCLNPHDQVVMRS